MPLPCSHLMTTLLGMSEKSRHLPGLYQTAPSVQMKPSAIFSSWASLGINWSKRGSSRSMVPMISLASPSGAGGPWAGVVATAKLAAQAAMTKTFSRMVSSPRKQGGEWRDSVRRKACRSWLVVSNEATSEPGRAGERSSRPGVFSSKLAGLKSLQSLNLGLSGANDTGTGRLVPVGFVQFPHRLRPAGTRPCRSCENVSGGASVLSCSSSHLEAGCCVFRVFLFSALVLTPSGSRPAGKGTALSGTHTQRMGQGDYPGTAGSGTRGAVPPCLSWARLGPKRRRNPSRRPAQNPPPRTRAARGFPEFFS